MFDLQYKKTYTIGAIQNAAKRFRQRWSFVDWSSVAYIVNTGVGAIAWVRCSVP
jgi:hypothetical protein